MRSPTAIDVARTFLDVLWSDTPPNDRKLAAAIDRLLAAVHSVPEADGADVYTAAPKSDWSSLYDKVSARFPDYGFYSITDPLSMGAEAQLKGDAIDDLADITNDLREVLWRSDHIGADDAVWYFRFSYETHWGRHARELGLYLHARISQIG